MPVKGVALVRIDREVHGTLEAFFQKLQTFQAGIRSFGEDANLPEGEGWRPTVSIGPMRPVWRLYTQDPTRVDRIAYNMIIDVTAATQIELRSVFVEMERLGCHVDGFGG